MTHNALVLRLYDEMAYSEDLHKVVTDDTKKFQVLDDGKVTEEFYRINDVVDSYKAQVVIVEDADHDKQANADEVAKEEIEYWDYWRETKEGSGPAFNEFLFVEMNTGNGWFQLWRGREIDLERVMMM